MLTDLVKQIGGDNFEVEGMMKAGVDPHLYKPTAGDVEKLEKADVVVVNGLHLEGQMGEILQGLEKQNKNVVTAAKNIPSDRLLPWDEEGAGPNDPHIWFSVKNWKIAAKNVAEGLKKADSSKAEEIDKNLAKYEKELDELSFNFYNKELQGQQEQRQMNKRALSVINNILGEAFGKLYVEKYFPAKAKEEMVTLVDYLKKSFAQHIKEVTWMSDTTKEKALAKLNKFTVKVGYPDKWEDYSKLTIEPAAKTVYFANLQRVSEWAYQKSLE